MKFHLAQVNVAQMHWELTHPGMKEFVDLIAPINNLGDRSKGFVWRYTENNIADFDHFHDYYDSFELNKFFFNMSVWESVEDLRKFVFESDHLQLFRKKRLWLRESAKPSLAMWWIAAGRVPTVLESREKLDLIGRIGPSAECFEFAKMFDPPK
jgi:hypothetical protein